MKEQAQPAAQKLDSVKTAKRLATSADDVTVMAFFATDEDKSFDNFLATGL